MYTIDDLTNRLAQLTDEERGQLFQIATDNAGLLSKIFPEMPLLLHIAGQTRNVNHPAIQSYEIGRAHV